ncbi:MAG: carbohydrate porin, partial [Myxococcota bacterium]|nr:carbohydrate porin [Myxococcota bacterium]
VEPSQPPAIASTEVPLTPAAPVATSGFRFGSYGRVIAGTDLRGGKPESANVVAHGPRIVEPSYLEIDLSYGFVTPSGKSLRPVITLAFNSTLFHETGEFDAQPALRNVYLDAQLTRHVTAWVGSRMYRGDDIYLFDYWPLDDLNTVGGGLFYRRHQRTDETTGAPSGDVLELAAHAGVNRLENLFQFQEIDVADPEQGATTVVQLNRQRMVLSGTASYIMQGVLADAGLKLKLHGEMHGLPSGTRRRVDGTLEALPGDRGYVIGAEVGTFGFASSESGLRRHLNLFARYAKGLAAFDELAPPTSFGADLKTTRANELSFGASGNWDLGFGHVMLGALSRRFTDADGPGADYDDGWEYALAARPLFNVIPGAREVFLGADVSYQARFPNGLNPTTQLAQDPSVFQLAPMLVYSPMGPSGYDRPQLRLVYRAAFLNEAAQDLYVPGDPRREHGVTHFLGVQAEWWFNSSTYR